MADKVSKQQPAEVAEQPEVAEIPVAEVLPEPEVIAASDPEPAPVVAEPDPPVAAPEPVQEEEPKQEATPHRKLTKKQEEAKYRVRRRAYTTDPKTEQLLQIGAVGKTISGEKLTEAGIKQDDLDNLLSSGALALVEEK